jgi:predicted lipid-binding transport protein (Tim44 family)
MTAPANPATEPITEREPVRVFLGGLAGVVSLGLIAATLMDWVDLTTEQTAGLVAAVAGICVLVSETLRARVYSPATVAEITTTPG